MANESNASAEQGEPLIYQIRIKGHLDRKWSDGFPASSSHRLPTAKRC
jgi:hypothetical protein